MRQVAGVWIITIAVWTMLPHLSWADSDSTRVTSYLDMFQQGLKVADDFLAHATAIPDSQEMAIGKDIAARFNQQNKLVYGSLERRLQRVGKKLTGFGTRKGITYTFQVLDSEKLNAFAIPGGNIWVTKAMLEFVDNDDQLAGILGHEIAHIDLRHCIRSIQYQIWILQVSPEHLDYVRIGHSLINSGYSKLNELEADQHGVLAMFRGGYEPQQMVEFMSKLEQLEAASGAYERPDEDDPIGQTIAQVNDFVRSHPLSRERKEKLQVYIQDSLNTEKRRN